MDSIEEYFQEEYIIEKNRINEIEDLLKGVPKTLSLCNEHGWPYELEDKDSKSDVLLNKGYSYSTSSMLLFVLGKFLQKIDYKSPIIPNIKWEYEKDFAKALDKEITFDIYKSNIEHFISNYNEKLNANSDCIVSSNTFGDNDPFTLSWLAEIITKDNFSNEFKVKFTRIALKKIKKAFEEPQNENATLELNSDIEGKNRRSSNHIFPLLRVIHLYKTITKLDSCFPINNSEFELLAKEINKAKSKLFIDLQNRVNQQISYSVLQNDLFDTAELVLSIEGLILLDDNRRIDENLLTRAFEILKANQKNNLYWRPLKPFVTSPQGDILLPLSIEIANSLLRICKHLETKKKYYFHEFFKIFENYSKWLLTNVSQCNIEGEEYRGWHSEHVQKQNVIHPWETAQVVIYLMNYRSMIQDRIAYKSLKKSGLSCQKMSEDVNWTEKWDVESILGFDNCYKEILEKYVEPRIGKSDTKPQFSMLLYGPPGTGKSSIAEDLASVLNWRLITITPSDFIKYGEADIEGRAKSIFKTLEEQKDCVILFDEIDRLILDRDSNYYSNQGDFYQFMTPSMLVKIKDLRTKERSIFIVATNYEERIDSAIKRSGRIDEKYLVNTLNLKQRKDKIKKFLDIENLSDNNLELIAKRTYLYTFTELKTLVKSKCKNLEDENLIVKTLIKAIESEESTIKLLNYKRRFQIEKEIRNDELKYIESSIFPYKEFLALLFLKLECDECDNIIEKDERILIKKVFKLPGFKLEKHFEKNNCLYNAINNYYEKIKEIPDDKTESITKE